MTIPQHIRFVSKAIVQYLLSAVPAISQSREHRISAPLYVHVRNDILQEQWSWGVPLWLIDG